MDPHGINLDGSHDVKILSALRIESHLTVMDSVQLEMGLSALSS